MNINMSKKLLKGIGLLGGLLLLIPLFSSGATILFPSGGGTGTSTPPTYGKVLVGNAGGTYDVVATSTLGITQDLSGYVPYTGATSNLNLGINSLILNSLNGPLQANNGVVSATTSVGVMYGGTGITSPPSYGQFLMGNAVSGYSLVSTTTNALGLVAGSDTQVQFNDSGIFGADSNFIWNKTTDRLGVQVTSPQASIHAAAVTGSGLDDVVTGSATLTTESSLTAPTVAITKIAMPAGGGGGGVSYVNSGAGTAIGSANGTVYYFRIYPSLDIGGGIYYKSQNYEEVSNMDPNDSQSYDIQVSWGTVTISGETVIYFVEYSTDGASFSPLGVYSSTSETFTGLSGSDPTTAWPTFYTSAPAGTAPTPFDSGSASAVDIGAGGLNEIPATIYVEVDSVTTILGTDYVSGTPTGGSFDDSGTGTYNAQVSWNDPGGSQTNAIVRVTQDGGSTWYYQYVGGTTGPYTFTSLSNDAAAQARWGQTYSGGGSTQYDFTPYDIGTSPSGGTFYSSAGTGYNTTVTDTNYYIFKHVFTGLSGTAKIVENESNTYGKVVSATPFYDVGYTSWADGVVVTPNSYGFTGSNQNRDYEITSYDSSLPLYGDTPLIVSTVSGSGSKYVALAWTLPSGVTKVKIRRQVNGGGYNDAKIVTGSSFDDDSIATWSDTTTVTPTSIVLGAGRFDKSLTTITDTGQLSVVDITGSGTRYSKISLGYADDSSSAPTYNGHIITTSSTGYLDLVSSGSRFNFTTTQGGTPMVILGNVNTFNNNSNSSAHFTVKGANDAGLVNIRVDRDTVGFGQAQSGSDPATTVIIQPARSTDLALILVGHGSQASTFDFFRTQTSGGSFGGSITVGGHFRAGAGDATNPSLAFRADSNTGLYNVSADVIGVVTGGTERERRSATGRYFGSGVAATDQIHITAGTTSVAPLRFTTGSLTTGGNIRTGQVQMLTDKLHFTITTGTAVKEIALNDIALTSGRVPFATTNGRFTDDADFTFATDTLTVTKLVTTLGTLTANAGGTTDGMFWNDTTQKAHAVYEAGVKQMLSGIIFTQTADETIANSVAETSILGTGVGTVTLPANFFVAGKTIRVRVRGHISDTGSPTVQVKAKLGSTTILDSTAITLLGSALANDYFEIEFGITCRTTGGTGTVQGSGTVLYDKGSQSANAISLVNTSATTIDTTASQAIGVTFQWGTADAANTITSQLTSIEVLN